MNDYCLHCFGFRVMIQCFQLLRETINVLGGYMILTKKILLW